jgi:glycine cleavage system H lipoate-binding protein
LEFAKALTEMFAPVSGRMAAVKTDLREHPERLCDDPHGTWIIKLEMTKPAELSTLHSSEQYAKVVASPPKPKLPRASAKRQTRPHTQAATLLGG